MRGERPHPPVRAPSELIVILLAMGGLALLAEIVVPHYGSRPRQAKLTAASMDVSNLRDAIDAFKIDVGRYPTTAEGLDSLAEQPPGIQGWTHAYVGRIPTDPWGNPYVYRFSGSKRNAFDLFSCGPDGISGTADDVGR